MQTPLVWNGKTSLRADVFDGVEPSLRYGSGSSILRRTSRDDYADRLASRGLLERPDELAGRPALVAEVQAHWHSRGSSACLFDAYISANRERLGWVTIVPAEPAAADALAELVATRVAKTAAQDGVEIVSVVLPSIGSTSELVEFMVALAGQKGWYVVVAGEDIDARDGSSLSLLGVRARVVGQTTRAIGFTPLPPSSPTRRAPFVELVLRAKAGSRERASRRALLSDIDLGELPGALREGWVERSRELRDALLTDHERRLASPRVTFAVPAAAWPGKQAEGG